MCRLVTLYSSGHHISRTTEFMSRAVIGGWMLLCLLWRATLALRQPYISCSMAQPSSLPYNTYTSHECSSHGRGFCFPLTPWPCPMWSTRRPSSLQHCLDDSPPPSSFQACFHLPTHESLHPYLGLQLWWDMSALYPTNTWTLQKVMSEWLAWHQGVSIPLNSTTGIIFCTRNHF